MNEFNIGRFKIRVWDTGPDTTADRYTVGIKEGHDISYFGMGSRPFDPQGFNQYLGDRRDGYSPNENWGPETKFHKLPADVKHAILNRLELNENEKVCLRCYSIYTEPSALSRRTDVDICPGCGTEEAKIDAKLLEPTSNEIDFVARIKTGRL